MHAHGRQIWPASFIEAVDATVLPAPSPASFGAVQPYDARPIASMQPHGRRPVFRPGQAPPPPAAEWPRGFSESQAPLATARSLLPAPNPKSFSYPETSPTPWLQRKASLVVPPEIVPPETDALAMLIRRSLLETQAPDEPGSTQSIATTPRLAPRDPVSTANMPRGAFP